VGALLAEREAIKARLAEFLSAYEALRAEHGALLKQHAACSADVNGGRFPHKSGVHRRHGTA